MKSDQAVLFWSGGKDAYLALKYIGERYDITLLTTFNEKNGMVPHQEIPVNEIHKQAKHLNLKLLPVELPVYCPNDVYIERLNEVLNRYTHQPKLVFGDLRLAEIRSWREEVFSQRGFECLFPIWERPYSELLGELWKQPVDIFISAVQKDFQRTLRPGMRYDKLLVNNLPKHIDKMGENGEFHTAVKLQ